MTRLTFIGDVHGKIPELLNLLERRCNDSDYVLQIGDMGIGFGGVVLPTLNRTYFEFIRGNHDDPKQCQQHYNYAGEYGYNRHNIFYLGGAWSIDHTWRKEWNLANRPKKVWWEDEELSQQQLDDAIDLYTSTRPRIVATHEAPTETAKRVLNDGFRVEKLPCVNTRTSIALQHMLDIHQPDYWFFGHYHRTINFTLGSTRFQCLNELEPFHLLLT